MKSFPFLLIALALSCVPLIAAPADSGGAPRERLLFDRGWRFHFGDPADAGKRLDHPEAQDLAKTAAGYRDEEAKLAAQRAALGDAAATNLGGDLSWAQPGFDDAGWRSLDLPHDWLLELPFTAKPGLPGGPGGSQGSRAVDPAKGTDRGWYRRAFDLPASDAGRVLSLEMDGVFRDSLVWLNGHCLGRHPSGYTGFAYDLTPFANVGGRNVLVVRVDAHRTSGWFYEGAGIYRHAWLVKTAPLHVAHWGTYVRSEVDEKTGGASLSLETTVLDDGKTGGAARLVSTVLDPDGTPVGEVAAEAVQAAPGAETVVPQKLAVAAPRLWSLETPVLYTLVSRLMRDGKTVDEYRTPFGIRTLRFDAKQGFFLNGKHVEVDGTCNHQDHAGLGSALPDRVQYFRIEALKGIGSNAYRTSHNPPAPELLDACDRLGMLVLDETRTAADTPQALGELRDLIVRDRNHPSVFLWSLGNEENRIQADDKLGVAVGQAMQDLAHKLDPGRLCTWAMNGGWGHGVSRIIDVMGYNYWRNGNDDKYREDFPDRPIIATEETSTLQTRGSYGDRSEGYVPEWDEIHEPGTYRETVQHAIQYYAERPHIAGQFMWTGLDYRGEPTPFGWPHVASSFGLLDACGFPKDNAWFLKAWWGGQPTLHLMPHWNWAGREGQPIRVWAIGNCDEVELFLNGKSQGRQPMPKYGHIEWQVPYQPGTLSAKGYSGGKETLQDKVETAGAPAALRLVPDRSALHGDGEDVSLVRVEVVDAQGRVVPEAANAVHFHVEGGALLGLGNGDPASHEPDQGDQRSVFHGLAQLIVQAPRQAGKITVSADAPGLKSASVVLEADGGGSRPCVP